MSSSTKKIKAKKSQTGYTFGYSLKCAWRGLKYAYRHERNLRIELWVAALVVFLIMLFQTKGWESVVLFLMIVWVITVELINTVLERVVDILKPRFHPYAKLIKDIMAAVVLLSALAALVVAIIIFWPYAKEILKP